MEQLGTVAIIGVGLIGGSIGMALRSERLAGRVVGVGRDMKSLRKAQERGAIDHATTDIEEGVRTAEVVVVCTPVDRIPRDVCRAAAAAPGGALITDAGSTKRKIVESVEADPVGCGSFVGAHPIAGSERSGASAARPELFRDRACVLTPTARTRPELLKRARDFWSRLGATVVEMSPAEHDEVLAYTSHLPHALAAALSLSVPPAWQLLAAGAYRDGTRVAAADTGLWTAIFRDNRGPLLKALSSFQDRVAALKYAVMTDDAEAIRSWWEEARQLRDRYDDRQTSRERDE